MRSLESVLAALVDRASPGVVRLGVPKHAFMREHASYEVAIQTRSYDELYSGTTVGEAIRSAMDSFEDSTRPEGDTDPVVPSWYRVSRMQREVVERTLERHRHEHMARAAEANIRGARADATAEYAMADAFKAAIDTLYYDEVDDRHFALEQEPLQPRVDGSVTVAKGKEIEANDRRTRKEREKALAATVAEMKAKNRERARTTKQASAKNKVTPKA